MNTNQPKKASQGDWRPAYIIAALHDKGLTLKSVAHAHGLKDSSSMSAALTRSMPSNEQRIAAALNLHPKEIWPSRYNADGTRKPQGFRTAQSTRVAKPVNGYVQDGGLS